MSLLNLIWPAIYVYDEVWRFWFLVLFTIAIETLTIKMVLKYTLTKSILAASIGNLVSGLLGTFIMMWAMLFWHFLVDRFLPQATFDTINWVATYVLMCLGSVFIESLTIQLIFKETIKRVFIPLLIGNLLTYSFIAYSMATPANKNPREVRNETIYFSREPNAFILLENTKRS